MDPFSDVTDSCGPRFIDGVNIDVDANAGFVYREADIEISDVHPYKYYNVELPRSTQDCPVYGPSYGDSLSGPVGPGGGPGQTPTDLRDLEVRVGNLEAAPNLGYDE